MSLETSWAVMRILLRFCSVKMGKSGRGWPLLSNVTLEAKIEMKSFALSHVDEMTSKSFVIMDTDALYLFGICLEIIQNFRKPICLLSTLTCTACVQLHVVFSRSLLQQVSY